MNPDLQNALASLPHGPSFRFLDFLSSLEPGVEAAAVYRVRGDEAFLEGHFPGNPMMPGVILIEAIAQLGGVVVQSDPHHPVMADLRLTGVRAAKIFGAAVPGDLLEIRAKVEGRLGGLVQLEGDARVGEVLLASAKVTLSGDAALTDGRKIRGRNLPPAMSAALPFRSLQGQRRLQKKGPEIPSPYPENIPFRDSFSNHRSTPLHPSSKKHTRVRPLPNAGVNPASMKKMIADQCSSSAGPE